MRRFRRTERARSALISWLGGLGMVCGAACSQDSGPSPAAAATVPPGGNSVASLDPAPPRINPLGDQAPPEARPYPELRIHGAPGPLAAGAVTEDWPKFLGPRHDGRSNETKLLTTFPADGPRPVWEMACGSGYTSPVIKGRRLVYTHRVSNDVHVDCLDTETGRRYWRHTVPCDFRGRYIKDNGPRSSPVIAGDRVLVHGVDGRLTCFDLATGHVHWKRDLAAEFEIPDDFFGVVPSPLVHENLLIQNLGVPGGPCVAAFDIETGRLAWGAGSEWGPSCASPVVATVHGRERLFVLAGGDSRPPTGGLMVLDPDSGALEFQHAFRSRTYESVLASSPLVVGDTLFITASYNTGSVGLALLEGGGLEELWTSRSIGLQFSNPVALGEFIYMIDGRSDRAGAIVCIDPKTGSELSRTDLDWEETVFYKGKDKSISFSIGEGSLLVAEDRLLCLGDNGHLLWLDASPQGAEVAARASLFRANESWTPPVVSRGLLYVCQNTRERFGREPASPRLMCFDLRGD